MWLVLIDSAVAVRSRLGNPELYVLYRSHEPVFPCIENIVAHKCFSYRFKNDILELLV